VRDLEDRVAKAIVRPHLIRFQQYLDGFNYNEKPFIDALEHWNKTKGIDMQNEAFNGSTFAKFWLFQNCDMTFREFETNVEQLLGELGLLARRLTDFHLVRHNPHQKHLDWKYKATPDEASEWELRVGMITQFSDELNRNKQAATLKIEKDKHYLEGRVWGHKVSADWGPKDTVVVQERHLHDHIGSITQFNCNAGDAFAKSRLLVRTLGLPPLTLEFTIDGCFAYCTFEPDIACLAQHIKNSKDVLINHTQMEYTPLAKAHIIENLTIY
jgi:hypothetical protein